MTDEVPPEGVALDRVLCLEILGPVLTDDLDAARCGAETGP